MKIGWANIQAIKVTIKQPISKSVQSTQVDNLLCVYVIMRMRIRVFVFFLFLFLEPIRPFSNSQE